MDNNDAFWWRPNHWKRRKQALEDAIALCHE